MLTEFRITPSVFDSTGAQDEWSLCNDLGKDKCQSRLRSHWRLVQNSTYSRSHTSANTTDSSFFTRDDLVDIKAAGLNAVRIPVGYWAVDVRADEPYVSGQYPYLIQAVQWAGELDLQVLVDLHGAPGSQNGQDNSGLIGPVLFPSNSTNADRSLSVLRNLTEEFSRDVYGGVVTGKCKCSKT
jgi:glucan 1,3-beta-glucosidase